MAARRYAGDHDFFGDEEGGMEQSPADEEDEEDWGLSSSSPSSFSPLLPAPPTSKLRHHITSLPSSPECSMDDDSSTDGDGFESSYSKRRPSVSLQQYADSRQSQVTTVQQRRAMIKELQIKTRQECLALCQALLPLQQQWRQELEDPIPGLITHKEKERIKRKDISSSRSDTHVHSSISKGPLSAGPTNQKNTGNTTRQ